MDYESVISETFEAICFAFELKDYEQISVLLAYLMMLTEFMTDTQISQLYITRKRLEHLARNHKC